MLFNSYVFIFLFLPVTLLLFVGFGRLGFQRAAIGWLVAASLFFYGWWDPRYLWLISGSIVFNYLAGEGLSRRAGTPAGKLWLAGAVGTNLTVLGWFKYADFLAGNLNAAFGTSLPLPHIVLPLGISFFTFTQIAYLVDTYRGVTYERNLLDYGLFVTVFPHLIAGPIIHHKDIIPQFREKRIFKFDPENLSVGLTIFVMGLFKKVVLADGIARYSTPVFELARGGGALGFCQAWGGALAYTMQIYFDFSGYSDMAVGLSKLFGVRFPVNFNSPYKAVNIIEFWRRWHMTLSRFLRDYLYISLGGNRRGPTRRYVNLWVTMLLGGLWHGAGWTFVIWGGLHGVYLMVNHAWRAVRRSLGHDPDRTTLAGRVLARLITFFAVILAWVFFRAENLESAIAMLKAMSHGGDLLALDWSALQQEARQLLWTGGLLLIIWFVPNSQELLLRFQPALDSPGKRELANRPPRWWEWQPNRLWAICVSALFGIAVMHLCKITEFLYFQF